MRPSGDYGYRIAGPPPWRRIPPVTRGTLILTAAGYLATISRLLPMELLTAVPQAVFPGWQLWRLLTYPLVNVGIVSVLFNLLLLWSFGSEMEPTWGSRGYALFLVTATVVGGILGVAAALLLPGAGFGAGFGFAGPLTALIVAWMLVAPNQPTSFFGLVPMTRKWFALIAVVVVTFSELEQTRSLPRLAFVLGGIPAAWFWVRGRRFRGSLLGAGRIPRLFRRRRFRVVKGNGPFRYH